MPQTIGGQAAIGDFGKIADRLEREADALEYAAADPLAPPDAAGRQAAAAERLRAKAAHWRAKG